MTWTGSQPADRVRLGVRDEGVYRVTAAEMAAAAGVTEAAARAALDTDGWSLTCQGRAIAWTTDGDALYFYGVPTGEFFAPENVYWLAVGAGVRMGVADAAPDPGSATNQWFMHSESYRSAFVAPAEARDARISRATLTNVCAFGEWVPYDTATTKSVSLPGFCEGAATGVTARVSVVSYKDGADFTASPDSHLCELWVNGVYCGAMPWSDESAAVLACEVPQGVVTNGTADVMIRNGLSASAAADFMLLDVVLTYPCAYQARTGALLCTGGDAAAATARGFASSQVCVWDITEPELPCELDAPLEGAGPYQVSFACGDAAARYAVFDQSLDCFEPSVSGVRDMDWSDPAVMPELAIVVPPGRWIAGFAEAVQPLADFRNAQGLRTRIIDAESIYNAFSDGLVHPKAFQAFSAAGVTNGAAQTLRYLLFAGQGGCDYKLEIFRLGESAPYPTLFPLYLWGQAELAHYAALLLPNDTVLGNAVGGAAPEVAVGRFIATTAAEVSNMVAKTINYELTAPWKNKAVFAACKQYLSDDPNFSNIVAQTAAGFAAGGWSTKAFYPAPPNNSMYVMWRDTRYGTGASYELASGAGLLYYFGHSSETLLGTGGSDDFNWFMKTVTVQNGTWAFAPVAMLIGCRIARWNVHNPASQAQGIAEAGVRKATSGFTAVISASGYVSAGAAEYFSNAFRDQISAGALRLGDAWRGAFATIGDATSGAMQHLTLLGDPALCIRAGWTARGTPAEWLIANGLTNNPYADLSDQDEDGFETWQEYQAGTSPVQGGLRIRALAVPEPMASGLALSFEPLAGLSYRVLSSTNLEAGVWAPMPWRTGAGGSWSSSGILGDWPLKSIEVPYDAAEQRRYYKVESY